MRYVVLRFWTPQRSHRLFPVLNSNTKHAKKIMVSNNHHCAFLAVFTIEYLGVNLSSKSPRGIQTVWNPAWKLKSKWNHPTIAYFGRSQKDHVLFLKKKSSTKTDIQDKENIKLSSKECWFPVGFHLAMIRMKTTTTTKRAYSCGMKFKVKFSFIALRPEEGYSALLKGISARCMICSMVLHHESAL